MNTNGHKLNASRNEGNSPDEITFFVGLRVLRVFVFRLHSSMCLRG